MEQFVNDILNNQHGNQSQMIYDGSYLIQYLDKKMKAVHGNSKTRRSLANIYAIYSIIYFYVDDYQNDKEAYKQFQGYDYMRLFNFYRSLYGGSKLQNHALNSRVNGEFHNKFSDAKDLIIINNGKYALHIDYLYVGEKDVGLSAKKIIEKYIELLMEKDHALLKVLAELSTVTDYTNKKRQLTGLITEDAEARIFEIMSYAILKNHYKNHTIFFGYTRETIKEQYLELYKTGRTNANDGGIDFVMRPVGRFFQVTEVNTYDKYLLDIDKVMHFPISFVIKTNSTMEQVLQDLNQYVEVQSGGMQIIKARYSEAIEEIITINELKQWIIELNDTDIDGIIRDIDIYYKLEMNMDAEDDEEE